MKRFIFFTVAILYATVSFSQTITILDKTNLQCIEKVIISNKTKFVETDFRGKADLSIFCENDTLNFNHFNHKNIKISMVEIKSLGYKIYMDESSLNLNEVLVSANKWEQNKKEVPFYIHSISRNQTQFTNSQTSADLLNSTGKVFVQKSQLGGGSPMIRGFSANRVLIVVDGVRMNNAIFRSGNLQNIISIDPESIENSEIIFGPGSVMYGSDALGGVMDFHTKNPRFSSSEKPMFCGNTMIRTSSASNEKSGHIDFNIGFKKVALSTSFSYNDFGDLKMGSVGNNEYLRLEYVDKSLAGDVIIQNPNPEIQKFSGYSQMNFMQKVKFRLKNNSFITYSFKYSATSDVPRYDRHLGYKNDILRYGDWFYGPQKWMVNSLNLYLNSDSKLFDKAKITLAHQNFEESRYDRNIYDTDLSIKIENVAVSSLNMDFEKLLNTKSILFYGAESVYNLVNSTGQIKNISTNNIIQDAGRYPDGSIFASNAIYLNYKNNLSKNITFTTGARYSYIYLESVFDNVFYDFPFDEIVQKNGNVTGSVGLVYRPTNTLQINSHISSGFRSPNIDDVSKVFDSEPGKVIVPNKDLKPEYAYDIDLGIIKSFSNNILIEITGFYTLLDNAIIRENFTIDGLDSIFYAGELSQVQALVNKDNATIYGIQTSIAYDVSTNFLLKANFNKEYGKTNDGMPIRHVAPTYGSFHIIYKAKKVKADLYTIYNGEISNENLAPDEQDKTYMYATDDNGNPYSPAWYTVNFRASYQINTTFQIQAGIENITDIRYRPYSSGIVAPGRNFILSLRANF